MLAVTVFIFISRVHSFTDEFEFLIMSLVFIVSALTSC